MSCQLWRTLRADLYRYYGDATWRNFISGYIRVPGFRFTFYFRKVAFCRTRKLWLAPYLYNRILWSHYRYRYGFDISPLTAIRPGLYLGRFGGVVISPHTTIGSMVNTGHGAMIGTERRGRRLDAPVIGNRVWIGSHAIVVGSVVIGDDALIAPGALVNFDVPPESVVIGNPGKIVADFGSTGYINRVMGQE